MDIALPTYCYTFTFEDNKQLSFTISTALPQHDGHIDNHSQPDWTRLEHHRCSPCTLKAIKYPFCPIALRIAELVTDFKSIASHTPCTVSCHSSQRIVSKETVVQEGLASILGLLMASSGCPVMDFFRPLARFHLPFASVEESIFRVSAAYMLNQYFRKDLQDNHFSLDGIKTLYGQVKEVNKGMLERIVNITELDADKNAIVTLSSLAQILEFELEANLESLQDLFLEQG